MNLPKAAGEMITAMFIDIAELLKGCCFKKANK
jgi:hypothetical protein